MRKTFKAFTLVELLVVIGIIALLISILLPALSKARLSALTLQCLSNQRQLGQGILMYVNDNGGWMPESKFVNAGASSWVYRVARLMNVGVADATAPGSWRMPREANPFRCPSATEQVGDNHYGSHPYFIPCTGDNFRGIKLTQINRPAEKVLLFDGAQDLFNDSWANRGSVKYFSDNIQNSIVWWYAPTAPASQQSTRNSWAYDTIGYAATEPVYNNNNNYDSYSQGDSRRGFLRWRHNDNKTICVLFADGHAQTATTKNHNGGELTQRNWLNRY